MLQVVVAGSLALSMLGAPLVSDPPAAPPSGQVTVKLVTINGSGCPAGSAVVAVSPDKTAFTVTYSKYLAQVGPKLATTDGRKNCQLAVQVMVPNGFTYAIASADYRGYAYLEKGATAKQQANYYFQGNSPTTYATHSFNGPMDDLFQTHDETELASMSYMPCGEMRYLNINTSLQASGGTSDTSKLTSYVTMDSADVGIATKYNFSWRKCPTTSPSTSRTR